MEFEMTTLENLSTGELTAELAVIGRKIMRLKEARDAMLAELDQRLEDLKRHATETTGFSMRRR